MQVIIAGLKRLAPGIPVLSEESDEVPFSERQQWQRYFLVDPLDGTKEFINRNGEFTVNIALIDQGVPGARRCLCAGTGCALRGLVGGCSPMMARVWHLLSETISAKISQCAKWHLALLRRSRWSWSPAADIPVLRWNTA